MSTKFISTIALILLSTSLYAQADFRKGFILTNSNDTIYGLIDYKGDIKNCERCIFKKDNFNSQRIYHPGEIKAYRFIDGKYYISYYLKDMEKDVFLEFLIDGVVDIYYYKDLIRENYFISKNNSELYELDNEIKEVVINRVRYEKESKNYLSVLRYLFSDSDIDLNKVNHVRLDHKPLINIAHEYHNMVCLDSECIVFEKKIPKIRLEYIALAFSQITNFKIGGINQYSDLNYKNNIGYSAGLGLALYTPMFNEKISLYTQILYCSNRFSSSSYTENLFGSYVTNYDFDIQYFSSSLGFKYDFPEKKIQPSFFIAVSYNLQLNSNANRTIIEEDLSGSINNFNYNEEVVTNSLGFIVGAAITILNTSNINFGVMLQYNYAYGRNIYGSYDNPGEYAANYSDFTNNISSLSIGLLIKRK